MFGKRTPSVAMPAASGGGSFGARMLASPLMANPWYQAGAAGFVFLLAAVSLVVITGNPKAGAPSVRLALAGAATMAPPGWRQALAPDQANGEAPVDVDAVQLMTEAPVLPSVSPEAGGGQAVITVGGTNDTNGFARGGEPLPQAPIAGLTEPGPGGALLPTVASDGRTPWQAYARPFHSNGKPKVALIIGGLGLNARFTRAAIEQLPPEVTLSFVPYSEGLQGWIDMARANGHEVLLEAPMEPIDYPDNDPGPYTLMAGAMPGDTVKRLDWLLSRATGYFGVTNYLGSKFVSSDVGMNAFIGSLRQRGLSFIDDGSASRRTGGGLPRASADRIVDDQPAAAAIAQQLQALEAGAARNGQALGSGFAYPVTLDAAANWTAGLAQRGYQLAPASALMRR